MAVIVLPFCVAVMVGLKLWHSHVSEDLDASTRRVVQLEQKLSVRKRVRQANEAMETTLGATVKRVAPLPQPMQADQGLAAPQNASVIEILRANRESALAEAARLSNQLARVTRESDAYRVEAGKAMAAAKAEVLARSKRIENLEAELGALNQQVKDLAEKLSRQVARVAEAERQLASAEGDRTEARRRLDALLAEKAELDNRFRSKQALTAQLKKLKEEEYAARDSVFRRNWLTFLKSDKAANGVSAAGAGAKAATPVKVTKQAPPTKPAKPSQVRQKDGEDKLRVAGTAGGSPRATASRKASATTSTSPRGSITAVPVPEGAAQGSSGSRAVGSGR